MPESPLSVGVLLCNGFSNMVLACALEPLRAVEDQHSGAVRWTILSLDGQVARSSSGLLLTPDANLVDADRLDVLIVIAGYGFRDLDTAMHRRRLRRQAQKARCVIGVDTGAWLLAAAGLLEHRDATIHWQVESQFRETFPRVRYQAERHVRDGNLWTAGGASTVLELMTQLIAERFGIAMAFNVSTLFLHDGARQLSQRRDPGHLDVPETRELHVAINRMVQCIDNPVSLDDIAHDAGLSVRSLHRLFRERLGMPPGRYYQSLRLARAQDLAHTSGLSLQELAQRCGFSGPATLCRAYRAHFGVSIRQRSRH